MKPDTREKAVVHGSPENKEGRRQPDEPTGTVCVLEDEIAARKEPPASRADGKAPDDDPNADGVIHVMENEMRDAFSEATDPPPEGARAATGELDPNRDGVVHIMENEMKGGAVRDAIPGELPEGERPTDPGFGNNPDGDLGLPGPPGAIIGGGGPVNPPASRKGPGRPPGR